MKALDTLARLEKLLAAGSVRPWKTYSCGICSERDGESVAATERNQDADLIVAAVNALPALIRLARAAEAWRDRIYPNSPTSTSDGVRICDSGLVAAVDALKALDEVA